MAKDSWSWHHAAQNFLETGAWDEAEEIYVSVGEEIQQPRQASSAINSLVFSILIPQMRFVEARIWLNDSMNLEIAYEAWNSLENLGLCEYFSGNNELAERHLLQVIQANDGPVEDASFTLDKIRAGKFAKPILKPDLRYSEEWRSIDISIPVDPRSTQREFYLRLIKILSETSQEIDPEIFEKSNGGCVTGFVNGVLSQELAEMGFGREASAKALFDYVRFVQLQQDPNENHFDAGLKLLKQGETLLGLKKLRVAAREGNSEAMLLVARGVAEMHGQELALPWFRLAAANGIQAAAEFLNRPSASKSGDRFCTECGYSRELQARFCVSCGNRFVRRD